MFEQTSTVAVVMSTYNGEKYLQEQIDSILGQRDVDVKLFIRDDGSQDGTVGIIDEYTASHENVVFWNKNDIRNLGVRDSFLTLLKEVHDAYEDIPYFAFADQDDVWKPEKLAAAVAKLDGEGSDRNKPALYYSNKTIVDAELNVLSEDHIKQFGDFFDALWSLTASGCTMLMNRKMAMLATRRYPDSEDFYHDSWIYRLAKICGAYVAFDDKSYILYRQHGNNVCGAVPLKPVKPERFFAFLKNGRHGFRKLIVEIIESSGIQIPPENQDYIDWLLSYDKSFSAWWHLATSPLARKRGVYLYCIWLLKLTLRKI